MIRAPTTWDISRTNTHYDHFLKKPLSDSTIEAQARGMDGPPPKMNTQLDTTINGWTDEPIEQPDSPIEPDSPDTPDLIATLPLLEPLEDIRDYLQEPLSSTEFDSFIEAGQESIHLPLIADQISTIFDRDFYHKVKYAVAGTTINSIQFRYHLDRLPDCSQVRALLATLPYEVLNVYKTMDDSVFYAEYLRQIVIQRYIYTNDQLCDVHVGLLKLQRGTYEPFFSDFVDHLVLLCEQSQPRTPILATVPIPPGQAVFMQNINYGRPFYTGLEAKSEMLTNMQSNEEDSDYLQYLTGSRPLHLPANLGDAINGLPHIFATDTPSLRRIITDEPRIDDFHDPDFEPPDIEDILASKIDHASIGFLQKIQRFVSGLGISILNTGVSYILHPLAKWLLSSAVKPFLDFVNERFYTIICLVLSLLFAFLMGSFISHSIFGGMFTSAILGLMMLLGAGNKMNAIAFSTNLTQFLMSLTSVDAFRFTPQDDTALTPSFGFQWFKDLLSGFGFNIVYFTSTFSKAWMSIRNIQDFGAFIFDMLPNFITEFVYQRFPSAAASMLFRSCGWTSQAAKLRNLLEQLDAHYSDQVASMFKEECKSIERFLSMHMQLPWYRLADTDFKAIKTKFAQIMQAKSAHAGLRPFMGQIGGAHDLGKTEFSKILSDLLVSTVTGYKEKAAYFVRPPDQFFDGYCGQRAILYKDILGLSSDLCEQEVNEWCGFYDAPYMPKFAFQASSDTAGKGCVVDAVSVIAATNFLHPVTVPNQNNLASYLRKRDFCIVVRPHPTMQPYFGRPEWSAKLAELSEHEKTTFAAYEYCFVHPTDAKANGFVAALQDKDVKFQQWMSATEMLLNVQLMFKRFRTTRPVDASAFQAILDFSEFGLKDKPSISIEKAVTNNTEKIDKLLSTLTTVLGAIAGIGTLIKLISYYRTPNETVSEVQSVTASRIPGKKAQTFKSAQLQRMQQMLSEMEEGQIEGQLRRFQGQVVKLYIGDTGTKSVHGIMLSGDLLMTVAHPFRIGDDFQAQPYLIATVGGLDYKQLFEPKTSKYRTLLYANRTYVNDTIIIRLQVPIRGMKDIRSNFASSLITTPKVWRVDMEKYQLCPTAGRMESPLFYSDERAIARHMMLDKPLRYIADSYDGICGVPLIAESNGRLYVLGIHCGRNGQHCFASGVTHGQLPDNALSLETLCEMESFTDLQVTTEIPSLTGNFAKLGVLPHLVHVPFQTALKRTAFDPHADVKISYKDKASFLNNVSRFGTINCKPFTDEQHKYGVAVAVDLYCRHAKQYDGPRRKFTPQEAVDALEEKKSVGYRFNKPREKLVQKSKDGIQGKYENWDSDFRSMFEKLQKDIASGLYPGAIIQPCPKDECVSVAKYDIKKTRTFDISSLQWTILGRMYTGAFSDYLKVNCNRLPSAIGMDVNSRDWHDMVAKMENFGTKWFDMDYKSFEVFVDARMAEAFTACMDVFYLDNPEWKHARAAYIHAMISGPAIVVGTHAYSRAHGNPSGMIGTCQLNSVVNTYLLACCYKIRFPNALVTDFEQDVMHKVQGDDVIGVLRDEIAEHFNLTTLIEDLADHDITATNGSKTAKVTPYTDRVHTTFLKARPLYSKELNAFVAYVDDDTAKKQLVYCRDTSLEGQRNLALCVLHSMKNHGTAGDLPASATCAWEGEFPPGYMTYDAWVKHIRKTIPNIDADTFQAFKCDFNRFENLEDDEVEILSEDSWGEQEEEFLTIMEMFSISDFVKKREITNHVRQRDDAYRMRKATASYQAYKELGRMPTFPEMMEHMQGQSQSAYYEFGNATGNVTIGNQTADQKLQGELEASVGVGPGASGGNAAGNSRGATGPTSSNSTGSSRSVSAGASARTPVRSARGLLANTVGGLAEWATSSLLNEHQAAPTATGRVVPPRAPTSSRTWTNSNGQGGTTLDLPQHSIAQINVDGTSTSKCVMSGGETGETLGDFAAVITGVTSADFDSAIDEMSQTFFTNHFSYCGNFAVPLTGLSPGTQLQVFDMSPFQQFFPRTMAASGGNGNTIFTRLETYASQFGFWRGSLKFRFHLSAPREFAVRMAFVLGYADWATAGPLYPTATTGTTIYVDFDSNVRDCVIHVPFISAREWLQPFYMNPAPPSSQYSIDYCSMGTLRIFNSTIAVGSNTTFTGNPGFNCYISGGDDMEFKRYLPLMGIDSFQPGFYATKEETLDKMEMGDRSAGTSVLPPSRTLILPARASPIKVKPIKLSSFAEKFASLNVISVTSSSQPVYSFTHPNQSLVAQAAYGTLAMNFYAGDLVVKVTPISSGWVGGHYILYFIPFGTNSYPLTSTFDYGNVGATGLDYVIVDLADNQSVELVIPFRYHKQFFTQGNSTDFYGTVVLAPFGIAPIFPTAGTSTVNLEVHVAWRNFKSFVPQDIGLVGYSVTETLQHMEMSDEDKGPATAAITSQEAGAEEPDTAIMAMTFQKDARVITHLSVLFKRMTPYQPYGASGPILTIASSTGTGAPKGYFLQGVNNAGLLAPFADGPMSWLFNQYKAWKGDLVYQVDTGVSINDKDVRFWVMLLNNCPTSGTGTPTAAGMLGQMGVAGYGTTFALASNIPYGSSIPAIQYSGKRLRFVVPMQTCNKFILTQNVSPSPTPLPASDYAPEYTIMCGLSGLTVGTFNGIIRAAMSASDSFVLSHYVPQVASYSPQVIGSTATNFPGQFFPLL
jgi:hypothetical protein